MDITAEAQLRQYEAVIILNPDVTEAEQKEFFKRNQETIKKYSGQVNHIDTWGKRRMANPINKLKIGTYFHTMFEAKGGCVAELERLMRIDERVLRYLHIKLDDRKSLAQHTEEYHTMLADSLKREQEKEARNQARKAAGGFGGGGSRGPREVSYGGKRGGQDDDSDSQEEI
ncbi:MAG: 30S ribosomal protein S6 [Bdellovibrionales bacterium RBG_16_40_8]|nr:MAG: 30S ribosomal protein S6 [Bdellovibrionales bacterium RBG_16_40_8]